MKEIRWENVLFAYMTEFMPGGKTGFILGREKTGTA